MHLPTDPLPTPGPPDDPGSTASSDALGKPRIHAADVGTNPGMRIVVLMGGTTLDRDTSLASGRQVAAVLRDAGAFHDGVELLPAVVQACSRAAPASARQWRTRPGRWPGR